jgi:hypothetical protein
MDCALPEHVVTQQQKAAVGGGVAPFERGLDFTTIKARKEQQAVGTVWRWRGFFGLVCNPHNYSRLMRKPGQYFALE